MRSLAATFFTAPLQVPTAALRALTCTFDTVAAGGRREALPGENDLLPTGRTGWLAWQEIRNKWRCFGLFDEVRSGLRHAIPSGGLLTKYVSKATTLEPYRALWVTEGLGQVYGDTALTTGPEPRGLLCGSDTNRLPPGSVIPLHTGLGLAFADRVLRQLPFRPQPTDLRAAVDRFVRLCRRNARPDAAEAALEALGLVVRNLYPRLVPAVDRLLAGHDGELLALFWHGVGRGLYFSPTNFLPSACWAWPGLEQARSEPPHELGRVNAVAGLSWALTLVNVRSPGVLELFLDRHGGHLEGDGAFTDGLTAAALVWRQWGPLAPHLGVLCRHAPHRTAGALLGRWERLVRRPCLSVLTAPPPPGGLGQVFRYRSTRTAVPAGAATPGLVPGSGP
jgi:hypothetical protein